jgi:hypothetical protein
MTRLIADRIRSALVECSDPITVRVDREGLATIFTSSRAPNEAWCRTGPSSASVETDGLSGRLSGVVREGEGGVRREGLSAC